MCNYQEAFPTFYIYIYIVIIKKHFPHFIYIYIYIYEKYHSSDGDLRPWIHNARDVFY